MADDKKNIPEVDTPGESVTPTAEMPTVTEPPVSDSVLTDQEAVTLEHEGLAALFEIGEAVPDPGEQPIPIEPKKTVLPNSQRQKRNNPLLAKMIPPWNAPARWWILPPLGTRQKKRPRKTGQAKSSRQG